MERVGMDVRRWDCFICKVMCFEAGVCYDCVKSLPTVENLKKEPCSCSYPDECLPCILDLVEAQQSTPLLYLDDISND